MTKHEYSMIRVLTKLNIQVKTTVEVYKNFNDQYQNNPVARELYEKYNNE